MGASLSTIAIRRKSPEAVREVLGLHLTGEHGTFPKSKRSGAMLPSGWYLVCLWGHEFSKTELQRISADGGEVVACFVEEHVMVSTAAGWIDGRESWSVTHDAQVDLKHLEVRGEPPREFARIRDELFAKQTEDTCDYIFDIPVEVTAGLVGFRYDERQEVNFEVLKRPSLFRRMVGK